MNKHAPLEEFMGFLHLAYAPICNQIGHWLQDDAVMQRLLAESKLYMIAKRREIFFENYREPANALVERILADRVFTLDLVCGETKADGVTVPLDQFLSNELDGVLFDIDIGPQCIKISRLDGSVIRWITPDTLLFHYWRGDYQVDGLDRLREFTVFELLYVGISKEHDSFQRLFDQGHKARTAILSNEVQIGEKARVTDETILLFFVIEDATIRYYGADSDFSAFGTPGPTMEMIAADIEKAFVKMLDPNYNQVKYNAYPRGTDGLYDQNFYRRRYSIFEEISLKTATAIIQGVHYPHTLRTRIPRSPDFIHIQGDEVQLVKAPDSPKQATP